MQEDTEIDEGGTSTTIGTEQQQDPMKLCGQHVQAKLLQDDTCQHECTVHILKLPCQRHMMQEEQKSTKVAQAPRSEQNKHNTQSSCENNMKSSAVA